MGSRTHENLDVKSVPFNKIFIDPKVNSRKKLRDIPELAKSIDEHGLLIPLVVTNGGPADHPYTLAAGFRRAEALGPKHLKYGSKLVNVIVVDDAMGPNLIENVLRAPLPALDLAKRLSDMKEGTYYDPNLEEGAEPKKYTTQELAKLLTKSPSHITNLVRVHENITRDVHDLVAPYEPPGRLLFVWAGKPEDKQMDLAKDWIKYMDALEKGGRKRQAKGAGNKATSNKSSKPGKAEIDEKWAALTWKAETSKGKEAEIAAAVADVLCYVAGEKRWPSEVLSSDDMKAFHAHEKAEAKAAEAASEEAAAEE